MGGFGAPRPNNWHLACMEILKHWWRIDRRRLAVPCEVVCPQPAAKAKREVARDTVVLLIVLKVVFVGSQNVDHPIVRFEMDAIEHVNGPLSKEYCDRRSAQAASKFRGAIDDLRVACLDDEEVQG